MHELKKAGCRPAFFSSLRGAKRRSNPSGGCHQMDCRVASLLAMTRLEKLDSPYNPAHKAARSDPNDRSAHARPPRRRALRKRRRPVPLRPASRDRWRRRRPPSCRSCNPCRSRNSISDGELCFLAEDRLGDEARKLVVLDDQHIGAVFVKADRSAIRPVNSVKPPDTSAGVGAVRPHGAHELRGRPASR